MPTIAVGQLEELLRILLLERAKQEFRELGRVRPYSGRYI
jgi:hypothetical protein